MLRLPIDRDVEVRLLEPQHAEEGFAVISANRAHIGRYLPWVVHTVSAANYLGFIEQALKDYERREGVHCGMWFRGRFCGGVGARIDRANLVATLGYWIAEDAQGSGVVTRSTRALAGHLFDRCGVERVEIRVEPDNDRSRAIPVKLGFREEGLLRGAFRNGNRNVDVVVYGMLRSEWSAPGSNS